MLLIIDEFHPIRKERLHLNSFNSCGNHDEEPLGQTPGPSYSMTAVPKAEEKKQTPPWWHLLSLKKKKETMTEEAGNTSLAGHQR